MEKQRVLFVCTHNSARSQMAEGMLRAWAGDRFEVASAGTEVTRVRPEAIAVMTDMDIDISGHSSKSVTELLGQPWDWVITVCDQARESCPVFPGAGRTYRIRQFMAITDRLDAEARHQATRLTTN